MISLALAIFISQIIVGNGDSFESGFKQLEQLILKKQESYQMELDKLKQEVQNQARTIDQLQKHLDKSSNTPVAFLAQLTEDTSVDDSNILYDSVSLNIGGAYDPFTGLFIPPVSGIYSLQAYAASVQGNEGPVYIEANSQTLCSMFQTNDGFDCATCTATVYLEAGASVRVRGESGNPARLMSGYSGFTGHLITESAAP